MPSGTEVATLTESAVATELTIGRLERDFLELMPVVVMIEPFADQDEYQQPGFGPGYTVRARVESTNREIRTANGLVQIAATAVYPFNPPRWITPKDRITLPGTDGGRPRRPPVLAVIEEYDEAGFHHFEIFLGANAPRV